MSGDEMIYGSEGDYGSGHAFGTPGGRGSRAAFGVAAIISLVTGLSLMLWGSTTDALDAWGTRVGWGLFLFVVGLLFLLGAASANRK